MKATYQCGFRILNNPCFFYRGLLFFAGDIKSKIETPYLPNSQLNLVVIIEYRGSFE